MENAWKGTPYYKDWLYLRNGTMFWAMRKFLPQTNEKYYSDIRITATTKSIQHQKQKNQPWCQVLLCRLLLEADPLQYRAKTRETLEENSHCLKMPVHI